MERIYDDAVLELARRLDDDDDPVGTFELASEMSDEEAELVLAVLDEVEAEERAASIAGDLRRGGLLW